LTAHGEAKDLNDLARAILQSAGRSLARPSWPATSHRLAGATGWLPRPHLLGAVLLKVVAATVDRCDADRHLLDLALWPRSAWPLQ